MDASAFAIIASLLVLFLLFATDMPVAFALAIAGMSGIAILHGVTHVANSLAAIPFNTVANYTLTVVPMFILTGLLVSHSGMIDGIFDAAQRLTRRLPGGLGVATVIAATVFGGVSGSSVADSATIGRVAIGEMSKRGYQKSYAAAIVAAAGTVAILIPPSVPLVVYGIVSGESIGALLLAGIVPGILTSVVYALMIVTLALSRRDRAGTVDSIAAAPTRTSKVDQYLGILAGACLFAVVIGGIYSGLVTATEAGALGAAAALALSVSYVLARKPDRWASLRQLITDSFTETGGLTATIFALMIGATIFTHFLVLAGVPTGVSEWVLGLDIRPSLVIVALLVILLPMGMFIDGLSMLLIVAPLVHPVAKKLGFEGVWFGIMFVKCIEIGLLTPPVGLNVFVVSGLFPDIKVEDVFRRIAPFVVAELIVTAILFAFPELVMFLPRLAGVK